MQKKIVIIGLGKRFKHYENSISKEYEILAIADSNKNKHGKYHGIPVIPLEEVEEYNYDLAIITPETNQEILAVCKNLRMRNLMILKEHNEPYLGYEALAYVLEKFDFETVLDVGCGEGLQAKEFLKSGKNVTCIDYGKSVNFEVNHNKAKVIIEDFNKHEFNETYDLVWCAHVLEHQLNVYNFLHKVHACMKEGGILVICVPIMSDICSSGHVTIWNVGLLMYNLILAGFDCKESKAFRTGREIGIVVVKKTIDVLNDISYDSGDLKILRKYFPEGLEFFLQEETGDYMLHGDIDGFNWDKYHFELEAVY